MGVQIHIVASLNAGGMERIVLDVERSSRDHAQIEIVSLCASPDEYIVSGLPVHRLYGMSLDQRAEAIDALVRARGGSAVFCHLAPVALMRALWSRGIQTIPVIHNARSGWRIDPRDCVSAQVPFMIACGEIVRQDLLEHGVKVPVHVIRHVLPPFPVHERAAARMLLSGSSGDNQIMLGMVGRVVTQKRYTLAVRLLAELRSRGIDACLEIIGPANESDSRRCLDAIRRLAASADVCDHVHLRGARQDARALLPAFDVFLNTSLWEGVSISTMEAIAAGLPVVTSDVGGQREIVQRDRLMDESATVAQWADTVEAAMSDHKSPAAPAMMRQLSQVNAAIWGWRAVFGAGGIAPSSGRVLFVTGNLNQGGAQRSLGNLVRQMSSEGDDVMVAVSGDVHCPEYADGCDAPWYRLRLPGEGVSDGLRGRIGRLLALIAETRPATVCWWNMDAFTKMVVTDMLDGSPIHVVDVSPGPMLYKELDTCCATEGGVMGFSRARYLNGLSALVSKYTAGLPAPSTLPVGLATAVIPNGIPEITETAHTDDPCPVDPARSVLVVGRLAASKHPELLPWIAAALDRLTPGATITVVGSVLPGRPVGELERLLDYDGRLPGNLVFAGGHPYPARFMHRFACLVMLSEDQGCPNTSLEAMMAGLPVIANDSGGTREQIIDGETGRIVSLTGDRAHDGATVAAAIATLLNNPASARAMGIAGQSWAQTRFSMQAMANGYRDLFNRIEMCHGIAKHRCDSKEVSCLSG